NPALARVSFGLRTSGVTLSTDPSSGALTAKDTSGVDVFASGTPRLWDSTGAVAAGSSPAPRSLSEQGQPREAVLATEVSATELAVVPPPGFLTDPATTFPAFIDPTLTSGNGGVGGMTWAQVYQKG